MGLDISKITNEAIKAIAKEYDIVKSDNVLDETEFYLFKMNAEKPADVTDTEWSQTLGLYVSNPVEKKEIPVSKNEESKPVINAKQTKEEKKYNKGVEAAVSQTIETYVETKPSVNLSNLVETLSSDYENEEYSQKINEVKDVVDFVKEQTHKHYQDFDETIVKIEENYNFNDFQHSLSNDIVTLAKKEQLEKEKEVLFGVYNELKSANDKLNYTEIFKALEDKKTDLKKDNTFCFYNEALKLVKADAKEEIEKWAREQMQALSYKDLSSYKNKDIRSIIKDKLPESDTFAREVVDKMKGVSAIHSRRLNYQDNYNTKLNSITMDEVRKIIGDETFHKLNAKKFFDLPMVKNSEGKLNLQVLADAIQGNIGADWSMDKHSAPEISEKNEALVEVRKLIDSAYLTETDLKNLQKLCKVEETPKSRALNDVFGEADDEAIKGTALLPTGFISVSAVAEADAVIATAKAGAKIAVGPVALALPAGLVALDALLKVAFGVDKDEPTCFDYKQAEGKTFEEYCKYLEQNESEEKAGVIAGLAKIYKEIYGEKWNSEFVNDMKNLAGGDSVLNCKEYNEFAILEKKLAEALKNKKNIEKPQPQPQSQTDAITTVASVTHKWKPGQSWQAMILAHYPEIFAGKTKEQIDGIIGELTNIFRETHDIGRKQGLPLYMKNGKEFAFKPITYKGQTYYPSAASPEDIEKCTSKAWYGYGNSYFDPNWKHQSQGYASSGDMIYTSTRTSDGFKASGLDERKTQDVLIPEAKENTRTTVTITNADGTVRKVIVDEKNK